MIAEAAAEALAMRPAYFQRQQVTETDLNALYAYDAAQWRAHNRAYHGCGVVCGLAVHLSADGKTVTVTPGYAVSPQGDEIYVPDAQVVALDCAQLTPAGCDDLNPSTPEHVDPVYVAIRAGIDPACFQPIPASECAPTDDCLPTRQRDAFQIACRAQPPAGCTPRIDVPGCSAHALLLGMLLQQGDPALGTLFGCATGTTEIWLTLATIVYERGGSAGAWTPRISYADRTYLPSVQFLFELARIAGAQVLKKQAPG